MKDEYARVGRADAAGRARRGRDAAPDRALHALLVALTLLPFVVRLLRGLYALAALGARRRLPGARCAPPAPRRPPRAPCAPTSTRSPTSRCCSARWSPTPSSWAEPAGGRARRANVNDGWVGRVGRQRGQRSLVRAARGRLGAAAAHKWTTDSRTRSRCPVLHPGRPPRSPYPAAVDVTCRRGSGRRRPGRRRCPCRSAGSRGRRSAGRRPPGRSTPRSRRPRRRWRGRSCRRARGRGS